MSSRPIYPSKLPEDFSAKDVRRMLESWRGHENIPTDVKVIGRIFRVYRQLASKTQLSDPPRMAEIDRFLGESEGDETDVVKAVRRLRDSHREMAALNRALMDELDAVERLIDGIRDRLNVPTSTAAKAIREGEIMHAAARDALREAEQIGMERRARERGLPKPLGSTTTEDSADERIHHG